MKTPIIYLFILTVGILGSVSCDQGHPFSSMELTAEADTTLVGPTWQLIAFVEDDGNQILVENLPEEGRGYLVEFREQTSEACGFKESPKGEWCLRALGHPNEGWLTYDLSRDDQSLTIYLHILTEVLAPQGAKEEKFFKALKAAKGYQINGKKLRLFYNNEKVLLFELAESDKE